jgi:uncharacterized surface protein with fasciclin (FAS1) repeats
MINASTADRNAAPRNLMQAAAANGFKTFGRAVDAAGLGTLLAGAGPFTVFAPTDAAFGRLPAGKLDLLLRPENKPELISILNYHVVSGRTTAAEIGRCDSAATVHGAALPVRLDGNQLSIDGARLTMPDLVAGNGLLHGIDKVNVPQAAVGPR